VALTTVLAVSMLSHEDTGTAGLAGALLAKTDNLVVVIDTVVLEDGELDGLALMLDLLGGGVGLLLLLLTTTTETEDKMEGGLLLDVVVGEGATVLELLTSEDQTLLIRRDSYMKQLKVSIKTQ
jgi:hypothetical protein